MCRMKGFSSKGEGLRAFQEYESIEGLDTLKTVWGPSVNAM